MAATPTIPGYLNVADVMERFGVSDKTVWQWIQTKQLRAYKIAGAWRIKPEDLDSWVARQCSEVLYPVGVQAQAA